MASTELLTSPPIEPVERPVIVVDSSDDEEEGGDRKRRRTTVDTESESVIDLTEDKSTEDGVRFRLIPKILKLPPFQFSDFDEEPNETQLESLRSHLRRILGGGSPDFRDEPPSPIDPDDLEITGVKESKPNTTSSSSSSIASTSSSTSSTTTATSSSSTSTTTISTIPPTPTKGPQLECAICLGEMKRITATTCGHVFCYECIKTAIQVTKCCPMCKKKLNMRSIHPLYI